MSLLVADGNRQLYYMKRLLGGKVFDRSKNMAVPYDEKERVDYVHIPENVGGNVYVLPEHSDFVVIVYEMMKFSIDKETGKKTYIPTESDKIVEIFGDNVKLSK